MSAIVDYEYYSTVYMGTEADYTSFPALCARAEDVIGALIRWRDPETLEPFHRALYKRAVCAQVDFFAVNGFDSVIGESGSGFTVGKVSVTERKGSGESNGGAMRNSISPLAFMFLEQSGLMCPAVPVVGGCGC